MNINKKKEVVNTKPDLEYVYDDYYDCTDDTILNYSIPNEEFCASREW